MITMYSLLTRVATTCAVLGLATTAQADLLVDVQSGSAFQRGSFANFGYTVTFHEAVRINGLGLWDRNADGLIDAHEVGLWDSTGTLLAQAVVDNASTHVASVNTAHAWLFTSITPLQLTPGTYKLGAYYPTTADRFVAALDTPPAEIALDPRASFGESFYTAGGTEFFTEPTSVGSVAWNPAFFGPNARLANVPEPATVALLGVGLALARWRSRTRG